MSSPASVEQTISRLERLRSTYQPNEQVAQSLQGKTLLLLVAPFAMGKTTVQQQLAQDFDISPAGILVTRPKRASDDPKLFTYIPHTEEGFSLLAAKIAAGELVQYAVFPTTKQIYATDLTNYPGATNSIAMLSHEVANMRALPFKRVLTFALITETDVWEARIDKRYNEGDSDELRKRLREAELSLTWCLEDTDTVWIRNDDGKLAAAAQEIQDYCTHGTAVDQLERRALARQLLARSQEVQSL